MNPLSTKNSTDSAASARGSRRLLLVTSWLIARLWWGIEMSRLMVFRVIPKARFTRITRQQLLLPPTAWVFDQSQGYCLTNSSDFPTIVIQRMPEISPN